VGPEAPPRPGYRGWVVVNYDLLSKHSAALGALPFTGVVFDEAHYLKNHTSQRSRLARTLLEKVPGAAVHVLTGTPLTNRPRDLFPLLQLAGHPMARSFLSFAKRYCAAEHNGFGWVTDGASNLAELRTQLLGVMLRRTKDEVLDLPPKLRRFASVTVPEGTGRRELRRVLETLLGGALGRAWSADAAHPERRGRGPGQDRIQLLAHLSKARQQIAVAKAAGTIEFVEGVVAQGEKAIVFSCFDEPVKKIAASFGDAAVLLTGATPTDQRQALVDRFQQDEGVRVFVANLQAGGVGLNLTAARQVVFNDLDWVPANHWQAEDRAYRIGQTGAVNVTYFTARGTVDEFVHRALEVKGRLASAVVDGTGVEAAGGDLFSELEALVRTLSPRLSGPTPDDEDPVDRFLREAAAAMDAGASTAAGAQRPSLLTWLPEDSIRALARVLSGPAAQRYRVASNSKPGASYLLDVDAGDVSCTCPGFDYRGNCSHARALKSGLAAGALPAGFEAA
jgi:SNF2 family DNA or RNA helicase